jgi:hypothetical protein
MDWESFGQGIKGTANTLAGALLEQRQRQQEMQDWYQKQTALNSAEQAKEARAHTFDIGKLNYQTTLDSVKKDFEQNPELVPYWQRAQAGDPDAQKVVQTYAGARYMMDSNTPLSSDQIAELGGLPPQTRHAIINQHLNTLDTEMKKQADLARTKQETATSAATAAWRQKQTATASEDNSDLYGGYAEQKKATDKAAAQKQKETDSAQKEIQRLEVQIGAKVAQAQRLAASKNPAGGPALAAEIETLKRYQQDAKNRLYKLTAGAQAQSSEAQANQGYAKASPILNPQNVVETVALTAEDKAAIEKAKAARPDLSDDEIIKQYLAFKKRPVK